MMIFFIIARIIHYPNVSFSQRLKQQRTVEDQLLRIPDQSFLRGTVVQIDNKWSVIISFSNEIPFIFICLNYQN